MKNLTQKEMLAAAETMRELNNRLREEIEARNYDISDDEYVALVHKIAKSPEKPSTRRKTIDKR